MCSNHDRFMHMALAEARRAEAAGNTPVAAVIVKAERVLAVAAASTDSRGHPLAHAEMQAIDAALSAHGDADLAGCTLYASMEPCPMCLWAMHLAGISRLVLGARHEAVGRPDLGRYTVEGLLSMTGQKLDLVTGICTQDCVTLRKQWSQRTGRLL